MNSRTKKILILSLISLGVAVAACLFIIYQINVQGDKLKGFVEVLDAQNNQEESFIRISRLVQETEPDRLAIASAFFTDESDSIGFLGDIESFAASIGLKLTTDDLNKIIGDDKIEYITMTFVYSGPKKTVFDFTQLLEHVPYHSWINNLKLHEIDTGTWEGRATIFITIATP